MLWWRAITAGITALGLFHGYSLTGIEVVDPGESEPEVRTAASYVMISSEAPPLVGAMAGEDPHPLDPEALVVEMVKRSGQSMHPGVCITHGSWNEARAVAADFHESLRADPWAARVVPSVLIWDGTALFGPNHLSGGFVELGSTHLRRLCPSVVGDSAIHPEDLVAATADLLAIGLLIEG